MDDIPYYHSALDTPGNLDLRSLQQEGDTVLSLVKKFANEPEMVSGGGNVLFFDVLGLFVVSYPVRVTIVITVVGLSLTVYTVIIGVRNGRISVLAIVAGAVLPLTSLFVTGLGAPLLWKAMQRIYPSLSSSPWGRPYDSDLFAVAFTLLAFAVNLSLLGWFRRRFDALSLFAGCLLVWGGLSILITWILPEASYPFNIPLCFESAGLCFVIRSRPFPPALQRFCITSLSTLPALLLWVVLCRALFSMVGLPLVTVPIVSVTLLWSLLLPLWETFPAGFIRGFSIVSAILGCSLVIYSCLFSFDSEHRRVDTLVYAQNIPNAKHAVWGTFDGAPDSWVSSFLIHQRRPVATSEIFPTLTGHMIIGEAPLASLPAPRLEISNSATAQGERILHVKVVPVRNAASLLIATDKPVQSVMINNLPVPMHNDNLRLRYSAPPQTGIEIVLTLPVNSHVGFTVDELSNGFAELPVTWRMPPRPRDTMAAPNYHLYTDTVLVQQHTSDL
jgi:hypothetical protein